MSEFLVIPAIELRAGMALKYENVGMGTRAARAEPVAVAQEMVAQGATWIHLYNLDGPFDVGEAEHSGSVLQGAQRNLDAVMMLSRRVNVPLQFGGGVRDGGSIRKLLELGAKRVALGEAAVLISINAKDGIAVGQEWVRDNPKLRAEELAAQLKQAGAKTVIYHDAAAEAAGQGPAVMHAARVGKAGVDVLVAGGISSLAHIRQCAATAGIAGVLAGKALAQGKFTLRAALETAAEGFKERK